MSFLHERRQHGHDSGSRHEPAGATPGKRTLTEAIQYKTEPASSPRSPTSGAPAGGGGRGSPLPDDVRAKMERALGADFSSVRIHEGPEAAAVGAVAYTRGTDIYFQPGQYDPTSPAGQELLGHELTHVVQQAQGRVAATTQAKGQEINDDPALEQEADAMGALAARGEVARSASVTSAAPGSVVQGKNLRQAGLANGLEDGPRRALVTDRRVVATYCLAVPARYESKEAALQVAAGLNAAVGKSVDDRWGQGNQKWTDPSERLDDDRLEKIDPFSFNVLVPYEAGHKLAQFDAIYQHAKNWSGYIVDFYDTGNEQTLEPSRRDNNQSTPSTMITGGLPQRLEYTNIHDTRDRGNLLDLTQGGEEQNLDAYTKIAGEGARWQCVRNHASNLSNESLFFTENPRDRTRVLGVTFRTLWLSWNSVFSKRYDIGDGEVRQALLNGNFDRVETRHRSDLGRQDYDLDWERRGY